MTFFCDTRCYPCCSRIYFVARVSLRPKFVDICSLENWHNLQSTSFFKLIILKVVRITGERCYFSDLTCLGIHSFFYKHGFFWGEEGVFLMKDTSKICGIAQKKYGPSMKIGLNHAFSESQKRKKECNSYFKYKQWNFSTWKKMNQHSSNCEMDFKFMSKFRKPEIIVII